ncbi:MAG TPA: hypothetical protein VGM20_03750 [Gemmatimonadales bacterium]|jgi:hypothetical protein
MDSAALVSLLTVAQNELRPVRLLLRDGTEVVGTPSSVDTHPTAYEAFLHPAGDDEIEIGVSLSAVVSAEMI